jgi:hypothetical protein
LKTYVNYLLILLIFAGYAPTLMSQNVAQGTLDRDRITAGENIQLQLTFPEAPTYSGTIIIYFLYKPSKDVVLKYAPSEIACRGETKAGSKAADVQCPIPIDQAGGVYGLEQFRLGPPPNGSQWRFPQLSIPDFEVIPVEDKNVYPASAVAEISLDQKQVLQDGASKISYLLDQLNGRVYLHAAETADLKSYLLDTATAAQGELRNSRVAYVKKLPSGSKEPVFLEDLERHYEDVITDLRGSLRRTSARKNDFEMPRFRLIQLSSDQTITVHPSSTDVSLGPLVTQLSDLLIKTIEEFQKISETRSTTFRIDLKSSPPGASISYGRLREPFQEWSAPTDVQQAEFPYALWTFVFKMGSCGIVKKPNPFIEKNPNLTVSMQNCRKK